MRQTLNSSWRRAVFLGTMAAMSAMSAGCAHFVETRAINMFAEALEAEDLEALKVRTSDDFDHKALRISEAMDVLRILRLPAGKSTVLSVEDISSTEKEVIAEVGEAKRKLKYRLKQDPDSKKWVVDDIYMKQRKQGVTLAKSVSEQMHLLLSVQEFVATWDHGSREDVLAKASSEFAEVLSQLPPVALARLTQRVVAGTQDGSFNPRAEMDENLAHVRLRSRLGEVVASFALTDKRWLLTDVAVESGTEKDQIRSVRELAGVTTTAINFLDGFEKADKSQLAGLCTSAFYQDCLEPADLSAVSLGGADVSPDSYRTMINGQFADFVLDKPDERVTISLVRNGDAEETRSEPYRVNEVTIYELDGTQEKRLSALFTAQAVFRIFSEALVTRDLKILRLTSTPDFNHRVWERMNVESLQELPMREIENVPPTVLSTVFQGALTEITVSQGSRALTYVLMDHDGQLMVDDVFMPVYRRPSSLKTTLELMIPIRDFNAALRANDVRGLQACSSRDFNRLVWYQMRSFPEIDWPLVENLNTVLTGAELGENEARVVLGDDRWGAVVRLTKESDIYAVDDVTAIAGPLPDQRIDLKRSLRLQLAKRPGPLSNTAPGESSE